MRENEYRSAMVGPLQALGVSGFSTRSRSGLDDGKVLETFGSGGCQGAAGQHRDRSPNCSEGKRAYAESSPVPSPRASHAATAYQLRPQASLPQQRVDGDDATHLSPANNTSGEASRSI